MRNITLTGFAFLLLLAASLQASPGESSFLLPTPEEAQVRLLEGNERFVTGTSQHDHIDEARRLETVSGGQHPFVTVIGCSDSRVPIEILFDLGIGDAFVVRVAGNVCDVDETGSIEYGVDHLNTPLLVILGHSHCGAVTAVAEGEDVHGSIPQLVDNILPAVDQVRREYPDLHGEEFIAKAVEANVWTSLAELLERSEAVRARVADGRLRVIGALYDLSSGRVEVLGSHPE